MAQWTDASRTTLISEFQGRPILWDRRLNDINSRVSKAEAIAKVTQVLNDAFCPSVTKQQYTVDDVKQQWKNLKDTFVRKQRWVNEGKYSRDPHEEPSWKFYRLLKFLDNSPEDASSPASPQAGNSNDGMNSRDGLSNSSMFSLSTPSSTSMTVDMDPMTSVALLQHQSQAQPSSSNSTQMQSLLPLSAAISGMDIKQESFLLGENRFTQSDIMNLMNHINRTKNGGHTTAHPSYPPPPSHHQLSPRANIHGHHLTSTSTPLKLADLEDTDTTTSPSSSRESHDSLARSLVLPSSSTTTSIDLRPLTSFPTSFDTPSPLSRVVHPNMSVENALRLSTGGGGGGVTCEPPPKKRKSYEARMATLMSSTLSAANAAVATPSPTLAPPTSCHQTNSSSTLMLTPSGTGGGVLGTPSPFGSSTVPVVEQHHHHQLGSGGRLGPHPPFGENDEFSYFGAFVASTLRRMANEGQGATAYQIQKSMNDIIFEASMKRFS